MQGEVIKETFGTMDFSDRNKQNNQFIRNLQKQVNMDEMSEQHPERSESRKMMRDLFPPDDYGYERLESLAKTEQDGKL